MNNPKYMRIFPILLVLLGLSIPKAFAQLPPHISSDWSLNSDRFQLKVPGLKPAKYGEGEQAIDLLADPDGENWKAIELLSTDSLYARKVFKVNKKPYTGSIHAIHPKTTVAFMAHFMDGKLHGNFITQKPGGMVITKNYAKGILQLIYYDDPRIPKPELPKPDTTKPFNGVFDQPVKKPILYFYPTEKQAISVHLDLPESSILYTYPRYTPAGWQMIAEPSGRLTDAATGREYYALYWEGQLPVASRLVPQGFVVAGNETADFLAEKLASIGLSAREANEFMIYWLPILDKNPYNFIQFLVNEDCHALAPLRIQPQPETMIRLWMAFQPLQQTQIVEPQVLPKYKRKGFTVVEWGGVQVRWWE